jgi:pilus assembly protein CpaF
MSIIVRISEPGNPGAKEIVKSFAKEEVSIGRSPTNDIVLAEAEVSGKHAKLIVKGSGNGKPISLAVVDNGSSNGTYVESERILKDIQTPVSESSRIIIGKFLLSVQVQSENEKKSAKEVEPKAAKPTAVTATGATRTSLNKEEIRIKGIIHGKLIERLDLRRKDILAISVEDLRTRAEKVVEDILVEIRWELPEGLRRESLIKQVLDEALGLGPLEELLADDACSEIMVNSFDMIYAERNGRLTLTDHKFSSEQAVLGVIERILAPIGRRIDEGSPLVDARLKDGSRVNAVIRPLALNGPCITIRKFSKNPLTIADLVKFGSISKGMAEFLKLAVEQRLNIVISGGTGSGKTTLLNVISSFVPNDQRIITVEDAAELRLPQEHVISFETRPPNLEGKGAIAIRDLVRNALRMRPDRIIVGECRGGEALDMLQAMNTGHDGSMTTGHANSPADMIRRLETMVLTGGLDMPIRAIREQIASAVHLVVQQTRFSCGTRKVIAISEVIGMDPDEGTVSLQDVFLFKQEGYGLDGRIKGFHQATGYIPKFFRDLQQRGLPVNADVFSPE